MRLFVAIDLDDDARKAIADAQHRIAKTLGADRSVKWVNPSHIHLTLVFVGEVADSAVPGIPEIVDALSADIDVRPFPAVFEGLGVFPPRGAPRVLWLGVGEGADEVVDLQRRVASRLARVGVMLESRPFHPHLTLARWRASRPADRKRVLSADARVPVVGVGVDHITLYHSRLLPAGPAYLTLARANLT